MRKRKGIESTFLHYGVRPEDMALIEQACQDSGIDTEWLKEQILKPYNEERNNQNFVEEKKLTKILKKALKNL
ncbi:MAG: hypothetical protein IJ647_00220 [Prevotella sp.]|nr:hypothetical protein [Prevotella sp.]